jgi:hypothetical protein
MKIVKYILIEKTTADELWREVNEFIERGFVPWGSPHQVQGENGYYLIQAVVLYNDQA